MTETTEYFTADDIREMLREHAPEGARGATTALAKKIGVTPKYLGEIVRGQKSINARVLSFFGLGTLTAYVKRDPSEPMPKTPLPYGSVIGKLRELEIGDTFYIDRGKRGALHAQAGRIGITIRTGKLPNGAYQVERIS